MASENDDDSRLLPPPETKGGLIKPAKKNPTASEHVFKAPEQPVSLYGLDKLGEAKRLERKKREAEETGSEPTSQRSKSYSYKDEGDLEDINSSKRLTNPEIEGQK